MHTTTPRFPLAVALGLALAAGGCSPIEPINAPASSFGSLDLSTYVAAGTSISAGYQSGGLVDRHQVRAFPAIFATQIGKTVQLDGRGTFTQPVYDRDGFPQLLHIVSYSPLVLSNTGRTTGNPVNLSQVGAYHDMGVPFAVSLDFVDTTFYYNANLHPPIAIPFFENIVRRQGSIAQQVMSRAPTFITWEYGTGEVLGNVLNGTNPPSDRAEQYAVLLATSLDAIHAQLPNTEIAVVNVPDVTTLPFATTLSAFTVSLTNGQPLPLVGANGPLQPGDLVLLSASNTIATTGTGIPVDGYNYLNPSVPGNGQPLSENFILRNAEIAPTRVEVDEINDAIETQVAARPYVALVDIHQVFRDIHTSGLTLGGTRYTSEFITGGIFSLDGVHPNDLAHALIANALIDAVNLRFGAAIRRVNPLEWASASSAAARPAFPDGRVYPRIEGFEDILPKPLPYLPSP